MKVCIYHSRDLDGWMSGAIVKLQFPNIELIGWDYGNEIPNLSKYDTIIMVDISFPKDEMQRFTKNGIDKLIWIDHHISAIKEMKINGIPEPAGMRNIHFAACELTWKYFYPNENMPELVRLLGRYDCFGHKGTDEERKVLEFQYGARQLIYNIATAHINLQTATLGQEYDENICSNILKDGETIYAYLCTEAKQTYAKSFETQFGGYNFLCVNQDRFNPINFGIDYHKDGYDGFACFWYAHGKWSYSLYNDNGLVDCSVIAKTFGGGGHKGAAGFTTDNPLNVKSK